MTPEHKAALERGRAEGRAVRDYLEGLRANKPKRGRKRSADTITKRLAAIARDGASVAVSDRLLPFGDLNAFLGLGERYRREGRS